MSDPFVPSYNPFDWYWLVGDDETQVWSSRRMQYLPAEASIRAEWSANDAAAKAKAPDPTPTEKIKAFLGNNPDVLAAVTKQK